MGAAQAGVRCYALRCSGMRGSDAWPCSSSLLVGSPNPRLDVARRRLRSAERDIMKRRTRNWLVAATVLALGVVVLLLYPRPARPTASTVEQVAAGPSFCWGRPGEGAIPRRDACGERHRASCRVRSAGQERDVRGNGGHPASVGRSRRGWPRNVGDERFEPPDSLRVKEVLSR